MARVRRHRQQRLGGAGAGAWQRRPRSGAESGDGARLSTLPTGVFPEGSSLVSTPSSTTRPAPSQPPPLSESPSDVSPRPDATPRTLPASSALQFEPLPPDPELETELESEEPTADDAIDDDLESEREEAEGLDELEPWVEDDQEQAIFEMSVAESGPLVALIEEETEASPVPLPPRVSISLRDEPLPWPPLLVAPTLVLPGAWPPPPGAHRGSEPSLVRPTPETDELELVLLTGTDTGAGEPHELMLDGATTSEEPPIRGTLDGMPVVQRRPEPPTRPEESTASTSEGVIAPQAEEEEAPTEVSDRDALEDALALLRSAAPTPELELELDSSAAAEDDDGEAVQTAEDLVSLDLEMDMSAPSDADVDPAILGDLESSHPRIPPIAPAEARGPLSFGFGGPSPPRPGQVALCWVALGPPAPPAAPSLAPRPAPEDPEHDAPPGFSVDLDLGDPVVSSVEEARRGVAVPPPEVRSRSLASAPPGPATDLRSLTGPHAFPALPVAAHPDEASVEEGGDDWLAELPEDLD